MRAIDRVRALLIDAGTASELTVRTSLLRALVDEDGTPSIAPSPVEVDLTAEHVADLLGRDPCSIRAWCREGRFPDAYRLNGREWRIPAASVRAFQDSQRGMAA